jgi:hypothetical protein
MCHRKMLSDSSRHYHEQLTHVSIVDCSVSQQEKIAWPRPLEGTGSTWTEVVLQLQNLQDPLSLHLERLKRDPVNILRGTM